MFYILNNEGEPVVATEEEWTDWVLDHLQTRGVVARDVVDGVEVTTSFIACDRGDNPSSPLWWQTYVSGGLLGGNEYYCAGSREQAEAMHKDVILAAKEISDTIKEPTS